MSRLTLSERIAIESGIYQRLSLSEIAKRIGKATKTVSNEIKNNRTIAKGEHPFGKDCIFAGECKTKGLCGKPGCTKKCYMCREHDCKDFCSRYNNVSCSSILKPPYVCNVCVRRRKCKTDRAYYIAQQGMKWPEDAILNPEAKFRHEMKNSQSLMKLYLRLFARDSL